MNDDHTTTTTSPDPVVVGRWDRAVISDDREPVVTWRPVYSGQVDPDIIDRFIRSAQSGQVVRLTVRAREED